MLDLRQRRGLRTAGTRTPQRDELAADAWWVAELAQRIGMPAVTLHHWIRRGWGQAYQQAQPPRRWIGWADGAEVERLCEVHQRPAGYHTRRLWLEDGELPDESAAATSHATAEHKRQEGAWTTTVG